MSADTLRIVGFVVGLSAFLGGVFLANIAVVSMRQLLNTSEDNQDKVSPLAVVGRGASNDGTVTKYRAKYGDGPLYKQLRFAYWLCGAGGVVFVGIYLVA
jgi:hypothetical protein